MGKIQCFQCQKTLNIEIGKKISKKEECAYCFQDLHCCKMCALYDPQLYNECKETNATRVLEKDKATFCEYFILNGANSDSTANKDEIFLAADALFKDK